MVPDDELTYHCRVLQNDLNWVNFTISLLLFIGILVSYLPQHVRIISRQSSYGISPYFVLLGATSGTCAFANILVLPTSRQDMACCQEIAAFPCFAGLLGIAQVGMQWSCFCLMYVHPTLCKTTISLTLLISLFLFVLYFPREGSVSDPDLDPTAPTFRTALIVTAVCVVHAVVVIVLSLVFTIAAQEHLQGWANFLGVLSTILASIQYFPQIFTTYKLKRVGSLSIPMMLIQTPGSFLWSGSLAARLGPGGWSAWGVYLVTGTLQGTLLVMGSYFEIMHMRKEKQLERETQEQSNGAPAEAHGDETTPLLRS